MLEVDQVHECKKLAAQDVSIRQISVRLGIARNTVRRYLRGNAVPGVYHLAKPRKQPVIGRVSGVVKALLRSEREDGVPRKQRLTAARIYRLVRDEHGYIGSESTVRRLVKQVRGELRDPLSRAFVPLVYEPGRDAQVDFFEAVVDFESEGRTKVYVLLVRPCFSGRVFVYVAPNQTQEALFEGLIQSFVFFGGVFPKIWFDNLTPAVRRVLCGRKREVQKNFAAFMAHYGFEAEFCRPACGNEKGGVENNVKFVRSEIFTPIPKVQDRSDLQEFAVRFMSREGGRTMHGRDRTIGELWSLESPHLLPLPAVAFEVGQIRACKVSSRGWISYGTNFYSVPIHLVGETLQVRIGAEQITASSRTGVEAVHSRQYGSNKMVLKLEHYLPLLERKVRAVDRALPVKIWLDAQEPCWRRLLEDLRRRSGEFEGSKGFVEAVTMCTVHGTEMVTTALRRAFQRPEVSVSLLRYELDGLIGAAKPEPAVVEYAGPAVRAVSAQDYDAILEVKHG